MNTNSKKPSSSLDKLRKLIREEVREAVKESIVPILVEVLKKEQTPVPVQPRKKSSLASQVIEESEDVGNPVLQNLLQDSKRNLIKQLGGVEGLERMLSRSELNLQEMTQQESIEEPTVVSSVDQMISSAGKSSKEELVEITNVPDFTEFMKKMK